MRDGSTRKEEEETKTKKKLTDDYLKYRFADGQYSDSAPEWLDVFDLTLSAEELCFGRAGKCVLPIVYTFYDAGRRPLYVGKTFRFNDRVKWHERTGRGGGKEPWMQDVEFCGLIPCHSLDEMDIIEALEIQKKRPRHCRDLSHGSEDIEIIPIIASGQLKIEASYFEDVFPYGRLFSGGEPVPNEDDALPDCR